MVSFRRQTIELIEDIRAKILYNDSHMYDSYKFKYQLPFTMLDRIHKFIYLLRRNTSSYECPHSINESLNSNILQADFVES